MSLFRKKTPDSDNRKGVPLLYRLCGDVQDLPREIRFGRLVQDSQGNVFFNGSDDIYRLVGYSWKGPTHKKVIKTIVKGEEGREIPIPFLKPVPYGKTSDKIGKVKIAEVSTPATLAVKNTSTGTVYQFSFLCDTKLDKKIVNKLKFDLS